MSVPGGIPYPALDLDSREPWSRNGPSQRWCELDVGRRLITIRSGTAEVRRHGGAATDGATELAGHETARRIATVGPGDVIG